jgi:hypothetical protein
MHRPVYVAHSSFIEGSHSTKNTVSEHLSTQMNFENKLILLLLITGRYFQSFMIKKALNSIFPFSFVFFLNCSQCLSFFGISGTDENVFFIQRKKFYLLTIHLVQTYSNKVQMLARPGAYTQSWVTRRSLACEYWTRVEVTDNDIYSCLLRFRTNCGNK